MEFLTVDGYVSLLLEELGRIEPPSGPVRRIGVLEHVPSALDIIRRDLNAVGAAVTAGNVAGKLGFATDLALETASYLYAAGAPHESWRRWSALTAFGRLSLHDPVTACPYLVLAGEWDCLMVLRRLAPGGGSPAARALWQLACGSDEPHGLPDGDDVDRAWRQLLTAVPARDSATIDLALGTIAEFWIAETEGDWRFFHPRSAPDFDPEPCAAATIARRRGWGPRALTDEVCDYLDAGLADGFPDPLYPQLPPLRPEPADRGE